MRIILKSNGLLAFIEKGFEVPDSKKENEKLTEEAKKIDPIVAKKASRNEILMRDARALGLI